MKKKFDGRSPPVTIVLPVYNGQQSIGRCLSSIEALDMVKNIRLVILDNASEDNTYNIASEFSSRSRFKVDVIRNKTNRGFLNSLIRLLSIGETDFSLLLGHDDFIGKDFFSSIDGHFYDPVKTAIITPRVVFFDQARGGMPHFKGSRHRADGVYAAEYILDNFNKKDDFGVAFLGLLNTRYFNSNLYDKVWLKLTGSRYVDLYLKGAFADIYSTLSVFDSDSSFELHHIDKSKVYKANTKGSVGYESVLRDGVQLSHLEYLEACHEIYVYSQPCKNLLTNKLAARVSYLAFRSSIKEIFLNRNFSCAKTFCRIIQKSFCRRNTVML